MVIHFMQPDRWARVIAKAQSEYGIIIDTASGQITDQTIVYRGVKVAVHYAPERELVLINVVKIPRLLRPFISPAMIVAEIEDQIEAVK